MGSMTHSRYRSFETEYPGRQRSCFASCKRTSQTAITSSGRSAAHHLEQIRTEEMMWQKLEYIHNNPVPPRYIDDPLHWRYSSARI
jgi:hypothetical protein